MHRGGVAEWFNALVSPVPGWSALGRKIKRFMYYVYLIYNKKTNKIYKGLTENLRERIKEYNCGKVKSTKNGRPWTLIFYEAFINKTDALK